ncbi:MAG: exonuclease SbcCD subunit D [Trueperaceae bacterium]|nr:exonuclease SbcCD subunit D [Trueperaceae bacterium]
MARPVRLLHTADWHLGKRLRDFPLLEEQAAVVAQVVELARTLRPDALVVAGDVFDTAVPGVEALRVWANALEALVDAGVPVVAISGNHDQAERLGHLGGLAARAGVHLRTDLATVATPVVLGHVAVYGLPFTRPVRVRSAFGLDAERVPDGDDAAALRFLSAQVLAAHRAERPDLVPVAVAHAFVEGAGREDEGEDAIAVGGTGAVPADVFDGFAYVALGHLHGRRSLAGGRVRYAGSLYPTSFAEAGHAKSVSLVTLEGDAASVEEHPLRPPRPVRVVGGLTFDEVLAAAGAETREAREGYVLVRVTDSEPIASALPRLRDVYPRSLLEQAAPEADTEAPEAAEELSALDPREVTLTFLRERTGQDASDLQLEVLDAALAFEPEDDA